MVRPISHKTLMKKSRNARNAEQFYKLANMSANQEWGENKDIEPFPVYKKADNIVNNVGWRNLLRSLKP